MIERIRVTLWDVLTSFLTGFFIATVAVSFWLYETPGDIGVLLTELSSLPAAILLVGAPLLFALVGLLTEPFANYADKWVFSRTFGKLISHNDRHSAEEAILVSEIKENYLGSLGSKIDNPFHICKDYVEAKGLSPTFMVFLARFGFYRNCTLIVIVAGAYGAFALDTIVERAAIAVVALVAAYVFKKRAGDFYSYQAPAVYRAFLVDKVRWTRDGAT